MAGSVCVWLWRPHPRLDRLLWACLWGSVVGALRPWSPHPPRVKVLSGENARG